MAETASCLGDGASRLHVGIWLSLGALLFRACHTLSCPPSFPPRALLCLPHAPTTPKCRP